MVLPLVLPLHNGRLLGAKFWSTMTGADFLQGFFGEVPTLAAHSDVVAQILASRFVLFDESDFQLIEFFKRIRCCEDGECKCAGSVLSDSVVEVARCPTFG